MYFPKFYRKYSEKETKLHAIMPLAAIWKTSFALWAFQTVNLMVNDR